MPVFWVAGALQGSFHTGVATKGAGLLWGQRSRRGTRAGAHGFAMCNAAPGRVARCVRRGCWPALCAMHRAAAWGGRSRRRHGGCPLRAHPLPAVIRPIGRSVPVPWLLGGHVRIACLGPGAVGPEMGSERPAPRDGSGSGQRQTGTGDAWQPPSYILRIVHAPIQPPLLDSAPVTHATSACETRRVPPIPPPISAAHHSGQQVPAARRCARRGQAQLCQRAAPSALSRLSRPSERRGLPAGPLQSGVALPASMPRGAAWAAWAAALLLAVLLPAVGCAPAAAPRRRAGCGGGRRLRQTGRFTPSPGAHPVPACSALLAGSFFCCPAACCLCGLAVLDSERVALPPGKRRWCDVPLACPPPMPQTATAR